MFITSTPTFIRTHYLYNHWCLHATGMPDTYKTRSGGRHEQAFVLELYLPLRPHKDPYWNALRYVTNTVRLFSCETLGNRRRDG